MTFSEGPFSGGHFLEGVIDRSTNTSLAPSPFASRYVAE